MPSNPLSGLEPMALTRVIGLFKVSSHTVKETWHLCNEQIKQFTVILHLTNEKTMQIVCM